MERFGARGIKNPFTIGSDLELPLGFDQHVLERFIKLIRLEKDNCLAILLVSFSALGWPPWKILFSLKFPWLIWCETLKSTILAILCELFRMVYTWPFQRFNLQLYKGSKGQIESLWDRNFVEGWHTEITRWWCQRFVMFTPPCRNGPI